MVQLAHLGHGHCSRGCGQVLLPELDLPQSLDGSAGRFDRGGRMARGNGKLQRHWQRHNHVSGFN